MNNIIAQKKYYSSVCLIIKNDHDLLGEWLQHYQRIGVDHIYVVDNGTVPPHREYLQEYIDSGYITYMYTTQDKCQVSAYNYILNHYRHETTWLAYFDSDEFLVLKQHANINDFLRDYENVAAAISVCWHIFGSNGHLTHQKSTILSYNKRVRYRDFANGQYFFKSIIMTDRTIYMEVHSGFHCGGYTAVDETKKPTFVCKPLSVENVNMDIVQLNHYVVRSLEDFQNKSNRGATDGNVKRMDYFYRTDLHANSEYDWSIIERHYPEYLYRKREVEEAEREKQMEDIIRELREEMANNR